MEKPECRAANITADLQIFRLGLFFFFIFWIWLFRLMLVPPCLCSALIHVHFDVFFNVHGGGGEVLSGQQSWHWHPCINKLCNIWHHPQVLCLLHTTKSAAWLTQPLLVITRTVCQNHQIKLKVIQQSLTTSRVCFGMFQGLLKEQSRVRAGCQEQTKKCAEVYWEASCIQILDPTADVGPSLPRLVFVHMPLLSRSARRGCSWMLRGSLRPRVSRCQAGAQKNLSTGQWHTKDAIVSAGPWKI